jgi:uncharacterized protein YggU (UPF0235/DUF167 family)
MVVSTLARRTLLCHAVAGMVPRVDVGLPPFLADRPSGCLLTVRVIPRAGRSGAAGERNGALLVRLIAAPVDGAANAALVEWLAGVLGVPRRAVRFVSGERSRDKRIEIRGATAAEVALLLARAGTV